MKYGKHTFEPAGKLDQKKCKSIANIMLKSHNTNIKMRDDNFTKAYGEKPEKRYSHKEFYKAMGDVDADIFLCDDGKQYIPCEHELMEFLGYR